MSPENRAFTVILEKEEDGGFSVYCPALPGCVSQGDDRAEALRNINEAVSLVLKVLENGATVHDLHVTKSQDQELALPYPETPTLIAEEVRPILACREKDGLPYTGVSIEQVEFIAGAPV